MGIIATLSKLARKSLELKPRHLFTLLSDITGELKVRSTSIYFNVRTYNLSEVLVLREKTDEHDSLVTARIFSGLNATSIN